MTVRASDLFGALYGDCEGLVELRPLPSANQGFFDPTDHDGMAAFCHGRNENHFFGVATRRDDSSGALSNCHHLPALFVDIDAKTTKANALDRLKECSSPPSIIIDSGGGWHAYWLLKEPLELATDTDQAYQLLGGLAMALDADPSAAEPARVLRIPGTRNLKYDPPRLVTVQVFEPGRRYNPSEKVDGRTDTAKQRGSRLVVAAGHRVLDCRSGWSAAASNRDGSLRPHAAGAGRDHEGRAGPARPIRPKQSASGDGAGTR